jgi:hypothetical protein
VTRSSSPPLWKKGIPREGEDDSWTGEALALHITSPYTGIVFVFSLVCGASARFSGMASPISFLQPSLYRAATCQFRIWMKSVEFPQNATHHLSLGFPTALLLPKHFPITFWRIRESSILTMFPTHCTLSSSHTQFLNDQGLITDESNKMHLGSCVISGFRRCINDIFTFLGFYTAYIVPSCPGFRTSHR